MQATKRHPEPAVVTRLLARPQRFSFVQAINLLLATLRRDGVPYERALREVFRFRNSLSLSFPASEIEALDVERGAAGIARVRLTPAFIGLLGAAGTLPLHDSERLADQQHHDHDSSQHALIDIFSNRMIAMFYETWGKYRVEHSLRVRGDDRLLPMLLALAGQPGLQRAGAPLCHAAACHAAILRSRPVAASTIERMLREQFAIPLRLEQFAGSWDPIPPRRCSTLGVTFPVLGTGTVLGTRLWRHDLRACLHIGPLDETQLPQFLPGGSARRAMAEMLTLFAAPMISWELKLTLAPPCIRRLTLTADPAAAPRQLGWNSFLTSTPGVTRNPHVSAMLRLPSLSPIN